MAERVDFDRYIDNYNELLCERTRFFSASEAYFARYKVKVVADRVSRPVTQLLEFGCGIGRNIPFLRIAFPDAAITGTDIAVASVDYARATNPGVTFAVEGSAADGIGRFDLIFIAGVFHHVPPEQRPAVAQTVHDRLSAGGDVFVFEHNPYNPVTRRIVSNCPYDADAVLLRPGELSRLLVAAGLDVLERGFCLFLPPSLGPLVGLEKYIGWLPLGGQYWVRARRACTDP
jgi:2-polyprenyl-3-methyl-5-hydroxy-6-metoxy-1,4-benzoquinol methylase